MRMTLYQFPTTGIECTIDEEYLLEMEQVHDNAASLN